MTLIKNPLSGGGGGGSASVVNGIIEQYKASSGTIDANTFVEFVNTPSELQILSESEDTFGDQTSEGYGQHRQNVAVLSSTKYVVCERTNITVVSYENDTWTVGTSVNLGYTCSNIIAVDGSTALAICGSTSSNGYLYARVVTVSGTTPTLMTATQLSTTYYTANGVKSAQYLNDSGYFYIAYGLGETNYVLYQQAVSISGTAVIAGTQSTLSSRASSGAVIATVKMNGSKVIVFHRYGGSGSSGTYLSADRATVSSSGSISKSTLISTITSSDQAYRYYITATSMGDGRILLTGCNTNQNGTAAWLLSYSDNDDILTEDVYTDMITSSSTGCAWGIKWDDNHVLIGPGLRLATISEEGISLQTGLGRACFYGGYITNKKTFVHTNAATAALVGPIDPITIQPATSASAIAGLTATTCTDTAAGGVWVLNTNESE